MIILCYCHEMTSGLRKKKPKSNWNEHFYRLLVLILYCHHFTLGSVQQHLGAVWQHLFNRAWGKRNTELKWAQVEKLALTAPAAVLWLFVSKTSGAYLVIETCDTFSLFRNLVMGFNLLLFNGLMAALLFSFRHPWVWQVFTPRMSQKVWKMHDIVYTIPATVHVKTASF